MPIFVGGTEITDIQIGNGDGTSTEINEVYVGANKVWERATTYSVTYQDQDDLYTNTSTGGATQYNNHKKRGYVQNNWVGYITSPMGSITPTAFTLSSYTGSTPTINTLASVYIFRSNVSYYHSGTVDYNKTRFVVNGLANNDGWSTVEVNGTTYSRASATHSQANGKTTWEWNNSTLMPNANSTSTFEVKFK